MPTKARWANLTEDQRRGLHNLAQLNDNPLVGFAFILQEGVSITVQNSIRLAGFFIGCNHLQKIVQQPTSRLNLLVLAFWLQLLGLHADRGMHVFNPRPHYQYAVQSDSLREKEVSSRPALSSLTED